MAPREFKFNLFHFLSNSSFAFHEYIAKSIFTRSLSCHNRFHKSSTNQFSSTIPLHLTNDDQTINDRIDPCDILYFFTKDAIKSAAIRDIIPLPSLKRKLQKGPKDRGASICRSNQKCIDAIETHDILRFTSTRDDRTVAGY